MGGLVDNERGVSRSQMGRNTSARLARFLSFQFQLLAHLKLCCPLNWFTVPPSLL